MLNRLSPFAALLSLFLLLGCGPTKPADPGTTDPPGGQPAGGGETGAGTNGGGENGGGTVEPGTGTPSVDPPVQPPAGGGNTGTAGPKVELSQLVPKEAFAAIVARPARALAAPILKPLPIDKLLEPMRERAPFDLHDVEQVTLIAIPPGPDLTEDDLWAVTFEFSTPANRQGMLDSLFGEDPPREEASGGKTYLTNGFGAVYFFNDTTVLVGGAPAVATVLGTSGPNEELVKRIAAAGVENDLVAAAQLEPVRELAREASSEAEQLPGPLPALAGLSDDVSMASAVLDLRGPQLLALNLEGADEGARAKIDTTVRGTIDEGKAMYVGAREAIKEELGLLAAPILQMADAVIEAVSVETSGEQIAIRLARPENLDVFVESMVPAVEQAVRDAQRAAERMNRMNNLKQLGLALMIYESVHGRLPSSSVDAEGKPLLSWRVHVLPFLEEQALYQQFKLDEPWDSPNNLPLAAKMPAIFGAEGQKTVYQVVLGEGMPLNPGSKTTFAEIRDGTANTILVVEAGKNKAVDWTKLDDLTLNAENPLASFGDVPRDGFPVVFADGHVQLITPGIDPATLKALFTHDGKEVIDGF